MVTSGKIVMSSGIIAKSRDLHDLTLRKKSLGNASLIEHLNRARVQTTGAHS